MVDMRKFSVFSRQSSVQKNKAKRSTQSTQRSEHRGHGDTELRRSYSLRRASTGSRREALEAGYVPKNKPTLNATIRPLMTDQNCTAAGSGVAIETSFAVMMPQSTPMAPPLTAIVAEPR